MIGNSKDLIIDDSMYEPGGMIDQFSNMSPEEQDAYIACLQEKEHSS